MSEKPVEKENSRTFAHCVYNKAGNYYKWLGFAIALIAIMCVIVYALIKTFEYVLPVAINFVVNTPVWITIPALILVTPLVAALIVCWVKRNEKEIKKADEEYTCPE